LDRGAMGDVVAEALAGAAVEARPEGRFREGHAPRQRHAVVVVGDARDHVNVRVDPMSHGSYSLFRSHLCPGFARFTNDGRVRPGPGILSNEAAIRQPGNVSPSRPRPGRRRVEMKVGIVGSGFVGATAAYALVMQGVGREIVLVDKNADRAMAEADDIRHAVPFANPLEICAGQYE